MRISSDDRRVGFFNLFDLPSGDLNIIRLHPGALCAWHRHQKQTDLLFCAIGTVKVGMIDREGQSTWHVLSEHFPEEYEIPPNTWHGYQNIGTDDAILVLVATNKYDGSDEERRSLDAMGISWDRQPR